MARLTVTIRNLGATEGDQAVQGVINFRVIQSGALLVEDRISGRCTAPFTRKYDVKAGAGGLDIEHDRVDLHYLKITACIDS